MRGTRVRENSEMAGQGHGDGDGPRPGQAINLCVVLAQWGLWLGMAGLRGAGDWPCCDIAEVGADGTGGRN